MEHIFAATKDLGLSRYFEDCADVRIQLRDLFQHTRAVVQREKEINLEVVLLIGALEQKNPAVNLGLWGGKKELAEKLGLTLDQYLKRAQAGRVLWRHPEFIELIRSGQTYVSHVGMLAAKITDANKDVFIKEITGKSERQVRELAASVNKDGSRCEDEVTFDLRLTLSRSQVALLERAREVLSAVGRLPSDEEAIVLALEDMLEKRDPMRKAERAQKRAAKKVMPDSHAAKHESADAICNPTVTTAEAAASKHGPREGGTEQRPMTKKPLQRRPIAAALKHAVTLRDHGRCSFVGPYGDQCGSRVGVQIDHKVPVALGGGNDLANLRLFCRDHNVMAARVLLGDEVMSRYWSGAR